MRFNRRHAFAFVTGLLLLTTMFVILRNQIEPDIKIGILDSGVAYTERNEVIVKSFVKEQYGYYANEEPYDLVGHGSAVYDIIKQDTNLAMEIYFGKVVDAGGGITFEGFYQGMKWLQEKEVDIISLSLGGVPEGNVANVEQLIEELVLEGVVIVASSGNDGLSQDYLDSGVGDFPATHPLTIGVGALSDEGYVASYTSAGISEYGNFYVDFVHNGASLDGKQVGTSFAVPRVTAQIAEIMVITGRLHFSAMKALLIGSTETKEYNVKGGWGVIDVKKATHLFATEQILGYFQTDIHFDYYDIFEDDWYSFSSLLYTFVPDTVIGYSGNFGMSGVTDGTCETEMDEYRVATITCNLLADTDADVHMTTHGIAPEFHILVESDDPYELSFGIPFRFEEYRVTIDGIGHHHSHYHPYGVYSHMTRGFNLINANVDYVVDEDYNFNNSDLVYSPYIYYKQFNDSTLPEFYSKMMAYVWTGGTWFVGMSQAVEEGYHFPILDEYITGYDLLQSRSSREAVAYNSSNIFDGVNNVYFDGIGYEVKPEYLNEIVFSIAHVGYEIPVGLIIEYGSGHLVLFGSSYSSSDYGLYQSDMGHFIYNLVNIS